MNSPYVSMSLTLGKTSLGPMETHLFYLRQPHDYFFSFLGEP